MAEYDKIFIWGAGNIARQVLKSLNVLERYDVIGFIDNDREKQGTIFWGKPVYAPEILLKENFNRIVILTKKYNEIYRQIREVLKINHKISIENESYFYKNSLLNRYKNSSDEEINKVVDYIKRKDLKIFNYDFADRYKDLAIDIEYDADCGLYYVKHQGKNMYFAKSLNTEKKAEEYYRNLLIEQDEESPHKYLTPEFNVMTGDVVVDVGVAEGNFSLEIVEKASKIYMIETDEEWINALKQTFKNYWEKVVIIPQFATSVEEGKCTTLDSIIKEPVHFIKMDVEGNEWDALLGAEKLIKSSDRIRCAVCSYHSDFDETLIKDILRKYGLECSASPGYMWYPYSGRKAYISEKLCRGIVRGVKEDR